MLRSFAKCGQRPGEKVYPGGGGKFLAPDIDTGRTAVGEGGKRSERRSHG
jgi:hypothetical protein